MMKKILLFVLLAGSLSSYAQGIFEIHYRHVPVENMQEFENLEMNYWYKVVQDAVDKGNLVSWSFHKRLDAGFVDFDEDAPTHAFVLVYKDIDQEPLSQITDDQIYFIKNPLQFRGFKINRKNYYS